MSKIETVCPYCKKTNAVEKNSFVDAHGLQSIQCSHCWIVHRRPRQWFHDIDRLHDILQSHGAEVLRRAMQQGLQDQVFGAAYIESFLQRSVVFQEEIP